MLVKNAAENIRLSGSRRGKRVNNRSFIRRSLKPCWQEFLSRTPRWFLSLCTPVFALANWSACGGMTFTAFDHD